MIKSLHPTLKACNCGFVGTRLAFINHMETLMSKTVLKNSSMKEFFKEHGEVPLNGDGTTGSGRKIIDVDFSNIEVAVMRGLDSHYDK